jgi:DNA polymerase-3 subunit delta
MQLETLDKSLAAGLKPVYCLVGRQPFQLELAKRKIAAAVPLGAVRDLNTDAFYVEQDAIAGVPRLANTLPMMSKWRLIVMHDWHKAKAKDAEALTEYLESPANFTVLVLLAEKVDGRSKLVKLIKKCGLMLEFERLYESKMRPWVTAIAETQGVKLAGDAVDYLVRAVGPDLASVSKEIEKAALHAGGGPVGVENLAAVLAAVKEQSFYEMFDAVAERNAEEALRILKEMVDQGQPPIAILAMLGRALRQLIVARQLMQEKIDHDDVARVLGMTPWLAQKTLAQARSFSGVALREELLAWSRVDLALKDGRSHDRAILERMVLSLCRRR